MNNASLNLYSRSLLGDSSFDERDGGDYNNIKIILLLL